METVVDENSPQIDPESEVRKLQDLVKQLEQQNHVLRKQNDNVRDTDSYGLKENMDNISKLLIKSEPEAIVKPKAYNNIPDNPGNLNKSLNDVEIIDIGDLKEEEDSWLYTSPNNVKLKKSSPSPLDWLRQDLEEASPEIASVRRSLVFKLNEAARVARSPSSGGLSSSSLLSPSPVSTTPVTYKTYTKKFANTNTSNSKEHVTNYDSSDSYSATSPIGNAYSSLGSSGEEYIPKIRRPLKGLDDVLETDSSRVNTGTFRIKKNPYAQPPSVDSSPADEVAYNDNPLVSSFSRPDTEQVRRGSQASDDDFLSHPTNSSPRPTPDRDTNGNANNLSRNSSIDNTSDSPRGSDYKLTDVVDVQVLARMQEDSLRQSMNSPKIARKNDGYGSMGRSNASLGSLSSNSDNSPANSPYSSQYLDNQHHQTPVETEEAADGHRRSMPNLAKTMPLSLRTVPSDPQLLDGDHPSSGGPRRSQPVRALASPANRSSAGRYQGNSTSSPTNRRGSAPQQYSNTSQQQQQQPQHSQLGSPQRTSLSTRTMVMPQSASSRQQTNSSDNNNSHVARSGGLSKVSSSPSSLQQRRTYSKSPARTLSPNRGENSNSSPGTVGDNRNKSPHRSSLPTPRSGIPRPGSASKLPGPRKTSIPASRRAALFRGENEDSWKDGCY